MPDITDPEINAYSETSQTEIRTKPKKRQKLDKKKVAALVTDKGLSYQEAANILQCNKSRIGQIMQEVKANPDYQLFADNKDKVFEGIQARLVNLLDDETLKKWLERRGSTDLAILQDKIQALRGQPQGLTGVEIRIILDNLPQAPIDVTPQDTIYSAEPDILTLPEIPSE